MLLTATGCLRWRVKRCPYFLLLSSALTAMLLHRATGRSIRQRGRVYRPNSLVELAAAIVISVDIPA